MGIWEIEYHNYKGDGISEFLGIFHAPEIPNIADLKNHIFNEYGENVSNWKVNECTKCGIITIEPYPASIFDEGYYVARYRERKIKNPTKYQEPLDDSKVFFREMHSTLELIE